MTGEVLRYTNEELLAVGLRIDYGNPHNPETAGVMFVRWGDESMCTTAVPLCDLWGDDVGLDDALLRLALAHPGSAWRALGEGWRVHLVGRQLVWSSPARPLVRIIVRAHPEPEAYVWGWCPPGFLAALQRAYLIAAAWTRIEAGSKRDPARPYCREPETCNGSCRRDPACCS